jgi:tight adherence protein C
VLPTTIANDLERRIVIAGEPTSLYGFMTMQVGGIAAAIALFTAVVLAWLVGMQTIGALAFASLVAASRSSAGPGGGGGKTILRALPDTVDLIVTMVEAGMSIDAALGRVTQQTDGPLSEELTITMPEISLGRDRREAMLELSRRSDVSELRTFVQSIVHAQTTEIPLGQILRSQAEQIRLEKRQRSEETAAKAPVKVPLLMLFFIMPSLLIVLLRPAFMRLSTML